MYIYILIYNTKLFSYFHNIHEKNLQMAGQGGDDFFGRFRDQIGQQHTGWSTPPIDPELERAWPNTPYGQTQNRPAGSYVPEDPDILRALQMQQEYARSKQSLLGRYTPQQLAQYGLSSQASTPGQQTPWSQFYGETAPQSTQQTANPTPDTSTFPSPIRARQEIREIQPQDPQATQQEATQQYSPVNRVHRRARRTSRGGGGGFCCFGGGGSQLGESSPDLTAHEDEDNDPIMPDTEGMVYKVRRNGEVDLGSPSGKLLRRSVRVLAHSTYNDCWTPYGRYPIDLVKYMEETLHLRYANPEGKRFSRKWLEQQIRDHLKNKKSTIMKNAREQVQNRDRNFRAATYHDGEWEYALEKAERERVTGVREHQQQVDARARQSPTHYGSNTKQAFKDKYEAITGTKVSRQTMVFRRKNNEYNTWRWLLESNMISRDEFDNACHTLQPVIEH